MKSFSRVILASVTICLWFCQCNSCASQMQYQNATRTSEKIKVDPIVILKGGKLRGITLLSRLGRLYYAFLGVPYASTSTRFQQVVDPPAPWEDIKEATYYKPICLQYSTKYEATIGSEFCHFINVFSPQIPSADVNESTLLPVFFYIHGEDFMEGSGNDYGAQFFMDEDAILVTFNYRLGPLGFLSTENSIISGNMGLKDQVAALKWTKDNIRAFSGDADKITIFGHGAGGASVSYLMLSPMARGLFANAISQSGTALCPWAFIRRPKTVAKRLAEILNCTGNSSYEMFKCLKLKDAKEIVTAASLHLNDKFTLHSLFAPSVERKRKNKEKNEQSRFLHEAPFKLMCNGEISRVPWIIGISKEDGKLYSEYILKNFSLTEELNENWLAIAPLTFHYEETARDADYVSEQIRSYYFGVKPISKETHENLSNIFADRYFTRCSRIAALIHSAYAPVYLYRFAFQNQNRSNEFFEDSPMNYKEMQFWFGSEDFPSVNDSEDDTALIFSQSIISRWVSFSNYGEPSLTDILEEDWQPVQFGELDEAYDHLSRSDENQLQWFALDSQSSMINETFVDRMRFWRTLPLHEYGGERPNDITDDNALRVKREA